MPVTVSMISLFCYFNSVEAYPLLPTLMCIKLNIYHFVFDRASIDGDVPKLGTLVSGVVIRLTPSVVVIDVNGKGYHMGSIPNEHLADHQGAYLEHY